MMLLGLVVDGVVALQLSVVHRDPEQKQPAAGHAVGVDRLVHRAPSVDQNGVKMSSGDKMKHNTQSSGKSRSLLCCVCQLASLLWHGCSWLGDW